MLTLQCIRIEFFNVSLSTGNRPWFIHIWICQMSYNITRTKRKIIFSEKISATVIRQSNLTQLEFIMTLTWTIYRQSLYLELNAGIRVKWEITLLNYKALLKLLCSWLSSINVHLFISQDSVAENKIHLSNSLSRKELRIEH